MRRIAAVVVVVLATLVGVPAVASAATPARPDYVALGDSYSSGVGTRVYLPSSGACLRSPLAYPELFRASHRVASFGFVACSGASVADVRGQLDAVTGSTDLVTLTVGGSDVGFSTVLGVCSNPQSPPGACDAAVAAGVAAVANVPAAVAGLLGEIRAKAAPGAKVVILGYPRLFGDGPCTAPGLPPAPIRHAIDGGTDALNQAIRGAAEISGATFVDVSGRFAAHGTCAPLVSRWINPPTLPINASYHPNIRGQALGYLAALDAALRADVVRI
jgi:lysophospholipase L1-like esterase